MQQWPNRKPKSTRTVRLCVCDSQSCVNEHGYGSALLFNFSESAVRSLLRFPPLSVQQKQSTVCCDSRDRKQRCMQPGNGLPSERRGGPVEKLNDSYLLRETAEGCSQIWSDNSIVQWPARGSTSLHVHHSSLSPDYVSMRSFSNHVSSNAAAVCLSWWWFWYIRSLLIQKTSRRRYIHMFVTMFSLEILWSFQLFSYRELRAKAPLLAK